MSTGAGVTVAVVDSGVDTDNPHLNGAVLSGEDIYGLDSTNTTGTSDVQPHGTPVATIIAGREVEGSSLIGVAPDAMIYPVRVYYSEETREGEPGFLTGAGIAEGIRRATASDAQIIVVALSQYTDDPAIAAAVAEAQRRTKPASGASNMQDTTASGTPVVINIGTTQTRIRVGSQADANALAGVLAQLEAQKRVSA